MDKQSLQAPSASWADQLLQHKTPGELRGLYPKVGFFYKISAAGAFAASFMFVAGVWLGGSWEYTQWTAVQWVSVGIALLMVGGITAGQYFSYDSGIKSQLMMGLKAMVLLFAVGSEVSQTMEREAETVRHRSEKSPVFQAVVGKLGSTTSSAASPLARDIAKAKQKLAQCEEKLKAGREKYCEGDRAAVEGLIGAESRALQSANQNNLLMVEKAHELQFDEKQHFQGIQVIMRLLGVSAIIAAFIFAMGIICTFEGMFYLLGQLRGSIANALKQYGLTPDGRLITEEYRTLGLMDTPPPATPVPAQNPHPNAGKNTSTPVPNTPPERPLSKPTGGLFDMKPIMTKFNSNLENQHPSPALDATLAHIQEQWKPGKSEVQLPLPAITEPIQEHPKTPVPNTPVLEAEPASERGSEHFAPIPEHPFGTDAGTPANMDEAMADPGSLALLQKFIENPKFKAAWIDIATGTIPCSQRQAMRKHGIGGDTTYWLMLTLEACEVVSEPNANKTRVMINPKTPIEAESLYTELAAEVGATNPTGANP